MSEFSKDSKIKRLSTGSFYVIITKALNALTVKMIIRFSVSDLLPVILCDLNKLLI